MAGLGGLPYFIQYQGQLQQQDQARQDQQMRMLQSQQAQQDRQRQMAASTAAGNALPQLMQSGMPAQQPQMPPPPQAPMPGQASQPQDGGVPLPPGMPPGAQGLRPPGSPGGVRGQMPPPGIPPFRPMPTTPPQSAAPQGAIPAPPASAAQTAPQNDQMEAGFSLSNIIQKGQAAGLSGSDLFDYVKTMEPYMTAQQKAKADQFKTQIEIKKLDAEISLHQLAAQNQNLSREERERHDRALEEAMNKRIGIAQGNLNIRIQGAGGGTGAAPVADTVPDAQGNLPSPKAVGGYSSEAVKALGEDYAVRGSAAFAGMGRGKNEAAVRAAAINYGAAINKASGGNVATNRLQYAADTAGARSNAVQASKVDAAANALVQSGGIGDQFQEAIDALERSGVPLANQAQMEYLRKTFDPRVAAYDAAQNGVVSEAAQILGRGTLTVNSMEEARRVVNGWHTSAQAKAGLAQLKREAATTVKASSEEVAKSARTPKGQPGVQAGAPAIGAVESGYRFKGGNPASPSSWERVQ